ncbi:MAG: CPBP family intramembrane glutamic endopeptidase [Candidatus Bathyarchaeota archaeon]
MEIKSKFDISYIARLFLITLVFVLTVFLGGKYGLNLSLLIADSISLIITPIIWKLDGILKFDIKVKYVAYYVALLIFSILLFPKDLSTIINILYRNGFREEVFNRFFMVGLFLKYGYSEDKKAQHKFLYAVFYSNILFMISHPYDLIGLIYILVVGIVFSYIYALGGLPSSILAHTIHNVYKSKEQTVLILLILVPLASNLPVVNQLRNKLLDVFSKK